VTAHGKTSGWDLIGEGLRRLLWSSGDALRSWRWLTGLGPHARYRALSSTWFGPTAPGRRSELVLPTLRWRRSVRVTGSGDLSSSSLGDDVEGGGVLRCTSGDGENTNGGGRLWWSFMGGWLGADGSTMAWWRLRRRLWFQAWMSKISTGVGAFYRGFDPMT
jgi:hypothetical protein